MADGWYPAPYLLLFTLAVDQTITVGDFCQNCLTLTSSLFFLWHFKLNSFLLSTAVLCADFSYAHCTSFPLILPLFFSSSLWQQSEWQAFAQPSLQMQTTKITSAVPLGLETGCDGNDRCLFWSLLFILRKTHVLKSNILIMFLIIIFPSVLMFIKKFNSHAAALLTWLSVWRCTVAS